MASQIGSSAVVVLLILCHIAYVNSTSWANGWGGSSAAGWSSSANGSFGGSSASGWGAKIHRKQSHHRGNQIGSSLNRDTVMDTASPLRTPHDDENNRRKNTRNGREYISSSQPTGGRISSAEKHSMSIPADKARKYGVSDETVNYQAHDASIESQSVWETRGSSSKEIYGKAFERHGSSGEAVFGGTSEHAASSPMSRGDGNGNNRNHQTRKLSKGV